MSKKGHKRIDVNSIFFFFEKSESFCHKNLVSAALTDNVLFSDGRACPTARSSKIEALYLLLSIYLWSGSHHVGSSNAFDVLGKQRTLGMFFCSSHLFENKSLRIFPIHPFLFREV